MNPHSVMRIEPAPEVLEGVRRWLEPVRAAIGPDFLAAYLTGSVLTAGWNPKRSAVNVLVIARDFGGDRLTTLAAAVPKPAKSLRVEPLFLTRRQVEHSLDVFPIEWIEIQERHLRLEGDDVIGPLQIPPRALRSQLEHELRSKQIRLRQAFVLAHATPAELERELRGMASSFAALFRTLLRLRGEPVPAEAAQVFARVADLYHLDAQHLLGAHLLRYGDREYKSHEIPPLYRGFLASIDRLVDAIDELPLP